MNRTGDTAAVRAREDSQERKYTSLCGEWSSSYKTAKAEIDCGRAPMTQNRRMHSLTNRIISIPGALMSAEINN